MKFIYIITYSLIVLASCKLQKDKIIRADEVSNFEISHYDYFNMIKNPISYKRPIEFKYHLSISDKDSYYDVCYSKNIINCLKTLHKLHNIETDCESKQLCIKIKWNSDEVMIIDNANISNELKLLETNCKYPNDSLTLEGLNELRYLNSNADNLNNELKRDLNLIFDNNSEDYEMNKTVIQYPKEENSEFETQDSIEYKIIERAKNISSFQVIQTNELENKSRQIRILDAMDVFSYSEIPVPNHEEIINKYLDGSLDILNTKMITLNSTERIENVKGELEYLCKIRNTESGVIIKKVKTEIRRLIYHNL